MAKRAIIPITDEGEVNACTSSYNVRYRVAGSEFWQSVTPAPLASPIVLENLKDSADYEVEIIRVCCNGQQSGTLTVTFTTSA